MAETKKSPAKKAVKATPKGGAGKDTKPAAPAPAPKASEHKARAKPKLDASTQEALEARSAKKAKTPRFRRHEWWRYKKLGGKNASWRVPRGIHSKTRRHFGYRPPLVSIGYRGPSEARGLHPSGFQEVLVHTVAELSALNKDLQAARMGATVGGRKAKLIMSEADKLGIRILNRREA